MDLIFDLLTPFEFGLAACAALAAGFVKGAVGFAMPMIMISALGSFLSPELALAALILPTLFSNVWQALRDGLGAAAAAIRRFRLYIGLVLIFILGSAQLVTLLPAWAMFLILGVPVTVFSVTQLLGWTLTIRPEHRRRAEITIGAAAGLIGGMSGVWGPPTVAYLTALRVPKAEAMRIQGVVYGAGAVVLALAHLKSGVLNAATVPVSLALVLPALAGLAGGFWVSNRLDQERFRRATLAVLVIAGLNLIRRAVAG